MMKPKIQNKEKATKFVIAFSHLGTLLAFMNVYQTLTMLLFFFSATMGTSEDKFDLAKARIAVATLSLNSLGIYEKLEGCVTL